MSPNPPPSLPLAQRYQAFDMLATLVAVVDGLQDYIVILSENRLLVCPRSKEQEIKQFVNDVKMRRGEDFV